MLYIYENKTFFLALVCMFIYFLSLITVCWIPENSNNQKKINIAFIVQTTLRDLDDC